MTAYEIALENGQNEDIAYGLSFIDQVPENDRRSTIEFMSRAIKNYYKSQELWEYAKEMDTPNTAKELKRTGHKSHKKRVANAINFLLDVSGDIEPLYGHIETISAEAQLEIIRYINRLSEIDINEEVRNDTHEIRQPNKKDIENLIKSIYKIYNIGSPSDTIRDLLPRI